MRKKILLLGEKGFLGEHLLDRISELSQYDVVVADRKVLKKERINGILFLPFDFSDKTDFLKYFHGVDTVIHLVSTVFPDEDTDNIENAIEENVFPTLNLLRSMLKANCKKIVFISSGGTIYGNHNSSSIREKESGFPISNYGIIKDIIEKYIFLFNYFYGLDYRIIRLANPYSSENITGRKQGIIPILIDKIKTGEKIQIWGDGTNKRDYIHIDDAIQAILEIMEYRGKEKIVNVGTGVGYSINDIIEILSSHMGVDNLQIEYTVARKCDVNNNILDTKILNNSVKFKPSYSLDEGIKEILNNKEE